MKCTYNFRRFALFCRLETTYEYKLDNIYPTFTTISNSSKFTLTHDARGGLESIELPSGHQHSFRTIPHIGKSILLHRPPWNENATKYVFDGQDQLERVIRPDGSQIDIKNKKNATKSIHGSVETFKINDTEVNNFVEVYGEGLIKLRTIWTCLDELNCLDYSVRVELTDMTTGDKVQNDDLTVGSDVVTRERIRVGEFVFENDR